MIRSHSYRSRLLPLAVGLLAMACALGTPSGAAAQLAAPLVPLIAEHRTDIAPGPPASDAPSFEVVLNFRYSDVVHSELIIRYLDDQPYLPLGRLFDLLKVEYHFDERRAEASGFFITPDREYSLDVSDGVARLGRHSTPLEARAVLVDDGELYVRPALLEEIFGLDVTIDEGELSVFLTASEDLPVLKAERRRRDRPLITDPYAVLRHAPLEYGRSKKRLGGGMADYGLSVSTTGGEHHVDLQTAIGAEVYGGDFAWSGHLGYNGDTYLRHDWMRWRYVDADNPLMRQLRIGSLTSGGLRSTPYHGLHISNQPATSRVFFGSYPIEGTIEPDWEVELYLNERLIGLAEADVAGTYRFDVPLVYGSSLLHVRTYGPNGEVGEERRRIQIPFTMLVPGETNYNAYVGRDQRYGGTVFQADMGYGVSDALTLTAGVDQMPGYERPLVYSTVTSRFLTHYLATASVTQEGFRRIALNGYLPSRASMELRYDRLDAPRSLVPSVQRHRYEASAFIPFDVAGRSSSVRVDATRMTDGRSEDFSVRGYLSSRFGRLQVYLNAQSSWSERYHRTLIQPSFTFAFDQYTAPARFLQGTLVTARARFDATHAVMQSLQFSATRAVSSRARVRAAADLGIGSIPSSISLRVSLDLPYARTSTDAQIRNESSRILQHVRGSVAWDRHNDEWVLGSRTSVGRSAAAVRLFVDRNGNRRVDEGEHVLEEQAVHVERSSVTTQRMPGSRVTHIADLAPYERYTLRIDQADIINPLWVPERRAFSFVADPNSVKPIDIPLYGAGIVEGAVYERRPEGLRPAAGLLVHLVNLDTDDAMSVRTFSDGTFYEMGLPPGRYEALPDAAELRAHELEVAADPSRFVVESTDQGDYVDGLEIVVGPSGTAETESLAGAVSDVAPSSTPRTLWIAFPFVAEIPVDADDREPFLPGTGMSDAAPIE